jgi:hypothetical protein
MSKAARPENLFTRKARAPALAPASVRIEFVNRVLPRRDLIFEPDPTVR